MAILNSPYKKLLFKLRCQRHHAVVARNKEALLTTRVQKVLKENFDAEIGRREEFSSATDFIEQAMAALVQAGRRGGKLAIPLAFLSADDEAKLRQVEK
jgi:hypothetical protein